LPTRAAARDKAPVDYFLVEESIIKRDSDFTLNLAAER
jgi:succinylglutamate desuccinylase